MYGFSGSGSVGADSKEGDRSVSGRSSAGVGAGASASASTAGMSRSSTSSSRNAAGREGTTSGPGNPSRAGADSKEGDRSLGARSTPTTNRTGSSGVNSGAKEGDRSLSAGVDPSRFGGRSVNTSTPTGGRVGGNGVVGSDGRDIDRSLSPGNTTRGFGMRFGDNGNLTDMETRLGRTATAGPGSFSVEGAIRSALGYGDTPTGLAPSGLTEDRATRDTATGFTPALAEDRATRQGLPTRGFGYATAFGDDREIDRSLATPSFQSFRSTDIAEMRRAQQDDALSNRPTTTSSVDRRNAAAANSAANALRADSTIAMRAAENKSMTDLEVQARAATPGINAKYGLTDAFMDPIVDHMIGVESSNNPKAKNNKSSAYGLGQFTKDTWSRMMTKYHPELTSTLSYKELQELRSDPALAREMTKQLAIDNSVHLAKNGIAVTPSSIYAAHFLGADGAVKAIRADRANPQQSARSVLGNDAANANPGIIGGGRTIGQVMGYIDHHMTMDAPKTITNHPTFADKYLGAEAGFGRVPDNVRSGNPEADYFGGQPSGISDDESGKNIAMWEQRQKEAAVPGGVEEVTTTSPGTDAGAPPVKERSIAGSLIGGGVDVLTSLNPLTAGVNLLTQLVTGKSLGDHIADGDNQYDGTIKGDSGSRGDRNVPKQAEIKKPGSTAKSATFADKYLDDTGFADSVKRPTPAQKWGEGSLPSEYGRSEYV